MTCMSMTGFGEGSSAQDGVEVLVEVKTVNHRYLDVVCRLPGLYSKFEVDIGKAVRSSLRRGRVEVSVQRTQQESSTLALSFNEELFNSYVSVIKTSLKASGIADKQALAQSIAGIYSKREVLDTVAADEREAINDEQGLVDSALSQALEGLCEMREREGAALEAEMRSQLSLLELEVEAIAKEVKATPIIFKERLEQRLEKLSDSVSNIEPERLAQEVVLLADRVDVTEELSRLESHFEQFKSVLGSTQAGRKLEFLLQEFGREVNTIGSKSQSADVTRHVVESKAILEKIREQVQNIE